MHPCTTYLSRLSHTALFTARACTLHRSLSTEGGGHEISFQHANSQRIALPLACVRLLLVSAALVARMAARDDDKCPVEVLMQRATAAQRRRKILCVCALFAAPRWAASARRRAGYTSNGRREKVR